MSEARVGLVALASPASVLCLVLLLLNDHVLKAAWPGWVTGKLSDVVGLVVAPLLLGVVLALLRCPRPVAWASRLVAGGFLVVKTSAGGAALVSAAWSVWFPTRMVADPTDLLALPAVLLAPVLWRRARGVDVRRTAVTALGLGLLPIGVLATAATSCDPYEGVTGLQLVDRQVGPDAVPPEQFVMVADDSDSVLVDHDATLWPLDEDGHQQLQPATGALESQACLADGESRCWRLVDETSVQVSADGGTSWTDDLVLDAADREQALEGHDESCGEEPSAALTGIVVLEEAGEVLVVVAGSHTGLWFGGPERAWERVDGPVPVDADGLPGGRPAYRLLQSEPPHRPVPTDSPTDGPASSDPSEPVDGSPACPSPSLRTVTPDPRNGPPTVLEDCP